MEWMIIIMNQLTNPHTFDTSKDFFQYKKFLSARHSTRTDIFFIILQ